MAKVGGLRRELSGEDWFGDGWYEIGSARQAEHTPRDGILQRFVAESVPWHTHKVSWTKTLG